MYLSLLERPNTSVFAESREFRFSAAKLKKKSIRCRKRIGGRSVHSLPGKPRINSPKAISKYYRYSSSYRKKLNRLATAIDDWKGVRNHPSCWERIKTMHKMFEYSWNP